MAKAGKAAGSRASRKPVVLRKPGLLRRGKLLAAAQELLETREVGELTLGEVAARAGVPKGSAYHFFADIDDLYGHLMAQMAAEVMAQVGRPMPRGVDTWQAVNLEICRRAAAYYNRTHAALQLQVGPSVPAQLKLRDRQNDAAIGGAIEAQMDRLFVLPALRQRTQVFFRAVELGDVMFCLSVLEHGRITPEMVREAARAMNGYLGTYLPADLPRRATSS